MKNLEDKFYSWYYIDETKNSDYVSLCLRDITKSSEALEELDRIQQIDTNKYRSQAKAWDKYHVDILLENILYLLKRFGLTLDDLKSKNKEEEIL